jgi:DNA-binding MarR family transcriptional regulator
MDSISSEDQGPAPRRAQLNLAVRESLRDLNVQMSLLNQRISGRLDLKGADLQCLDFIDRYGPLSPSTLARRAGLHPATVTGIIDRLERGGWIVRERDPADRRAVLVQPLPSRRSEVLRLASGMNAAIARICAGYPDDDLELIADFLSRAADAGRTAAEELDAS